MKYNDVEKDNILIHLYWTKLKFVINIKYNEVWSLCWCFYDDDDDDDDDHFSLYLKIFHPCDAQFHSCWILFLDTPTGGSVWLSEIGSTVEGKRADFKVGMNMWTTLSTLNSFVQVVIWNTLQLTVLHSTSDPIKSTDLQNAHWPILHKIRWVSPVVPNIGIGTLPQDPRWI